MVGEVRNNIKTVCLLLVIISIIGCIKEPNDPVGGSDVDLTNIEYNPTPFTPEIPFNFPALEVPIDNPLTIEGIDLGRHLFYDPLLSADSTMSCSSCHLPELHFQDNTATSIGIDGINGHRSSMSLINVGFNYNGLFWDGRASTLEEQALLPVEDPVELHNQWPNVLDKLRKIPLYQTKFREAFGIDNTDEISKELAAKALASFERIIIAGKDSKYTKVYENLDVFSDDELLGEDIFVDNGVFDTNDGECSHCHAAPLFTINDYRNNGLDSVGPGLSGLDEFSDYGRFHATGVQSDKGKFKATSLYNIGFTGPFMHDGRFETIDEVLDHYNKGGNPGINVDSNIRPLNLSSEQLNALKDFLATLVDTSYYKNPMLQNPF